MSASRWGCRVLVGLAAGGLLCCACTLPAQTPRVTVDTVGDTVVVTTLASGLDAVLPVFVAGPPLPVWGRDSLARPSALVRLPDGRFVVADGPRLFVLSAEGALLSAIGRAGGGPGEFRVIDGLATAGGDTVLVWDGRQRRLTWLRASTGRVLKTMSVAAPAGASTAKAVQLQRVGQATIVAWGPDAVRPNGPPDEHVLMRVPFDGSPGVEVARLTDVAWVMGRERRMAGPADPFGPRALHAISAGGAVAAATGVPYCVAIAGGAAHPHLRICREWPRRPVGAAARPPSGLQPGEGGLMATALADLVPAQRPSEFWNAIAELRYGADGTLWVKVVDSTWTVHPFYASVRRLRPERYLWEGFTPDGRLARRVSVTSDFTPLWFDTTSVYGALEEEGGELGVARIELPRGPRMRAPSGPRPRSWGGARAQGIRQTGCVRCRGLRRAGGNALPAGAPARGRRPVLRGGLAADPDRRGLGARRHAAAGSDGPIDAPC